MNKKLPGLYVNQIDKKINNNTTASYSSRNNIVQEDVIVPVKADESKYSEEDINEKIYEIFSSPNYVYKMNVVITTKDKKVLNKDIIGQVDGKLLTIDEDLIDIKDIREIKF